MTMQPRSSPPRLNLGWALTASSRNGEIADALVFLLLAGIWLAVGGTGLVISGQRGSAPGLWCFALFLALPPGIGLARLCPGGGAGALPATPQRTGLGGG